MNPSVLGLNAAKLGNTAASADVSAPNQVAKVAANWSTLAVMFLDLDRSKNMNDTHGHDVGDGVLKVVANRLMEHARAEDTVCRNGGDESGKHRHCRLSRWRDHGRAIDKKRRHCHVSGQAKCRQSDILPRR
jgi:diguanylate cyclase (GGDEF)-like protein